MPTERQVGEQEQQQDFSGQHFTTFFPPVSVPLLDYYINQLERGQDLTEDQMSRLNDMFGRDFATRQAYLGQLGGLSEYDVSGRRGYLDYLGGLIGEGVKGLRPETEAAMRTGALEDVTRQYSGLEGRLKTELGRRGIVGGGGPSSGLYASNLMPLLASREALQAQLLQRIPLEKQAATERGLEYGMRGVGMGLGAINPYQSIAMGLGAANPYQASSLYNQALATRAGMMPPPYTPSVFPNILSTSGTEHGHGFNVGTQSQPSGIWQALLGAGASAAAAAAFCWIARALYGPTDWRTAFIRWWLLRWAGRSRVGRIVVAGYRSFGERIARSVERNKLVRMAFKALFDAFVRRAIQEAEQCL